MSVMNIKEMRVKAGLSQQQLGRLIGVDQATISRIETGRQEPTLKQAQEIASACGYVLRLARAKRSRAA